MKKLLPIYSNQKSFYKKAYYIDENDNTTLYSYNTKILNLNTSCNKCIITFYKYGKHSKTTNKHILEFLKQNYLNDKILKLAYKDAKAVKETITKEYNN